MSDEGAAASERALLSARSINQPFGLAMALFWAAVLRLWRGERAALAELRAELRVVTAQYGISYLAASATVLEGEDLIASGETKKGIARVLSGLAELERQKGGLGWPWAMSIIAEGYFKAGDYGAALDAVEQALHRARVNDERHWEAELHRLNGQILLARPQLSDTPAAAHFAHALRVARAQGARALEARCLLSLAEAGSDKSTKSHDESSRSRQELPV